jgi:peptide/nickel transport system permease protein
MFRLISRRLAIGLGIALAMSVLVFVGTEVLPGDAATAILGRNANPAATAALREKLGLDAPIPQRYAQWLGKSVRGDFGTSFAADEPVARYISDRMTNTGLLALGAFLVILPLSILLGVWSGARAHRGLDHMISTGTLGAAALPEFVVGSLLAAVVAAKFGLLPPVSLVAPGASPLAHPSILVLPVLTLVITGVAYPTRILRASVVDLLESDFVQMARLNGVGETRIVWRHVLPNALAPSIQAFALTLQYLIGGVIVVETVFQYPGIGGGLVNAVLVRDIPVVQAIALLIAATYIVINVFADVLVVLVTPKLRTRRAGV